MKNIFVGSLDFNIAEEQLRTRFTAHRTVESIAIVNDRDTGQPLGFAFVEMEKAEQANAAISSLDAVLLNGRTLRVNEARPKLEPDVSRNSSGSRDHRRHQI